ncbi:MAG: DNA mismatch repair endonuclease MutL [Candidatus Omnitrophica bacterium]|nr:DNA mismatch repair endonuclease MutL [Candidatus Omnitrophota bacterium]
MIRILPEEVANKIAAGEVVERPASVVKELVENSLDAGASEIEILIKHGGLSLIRVSDNGSGMAPEDARLSVVRYATSKIKSVEDIFKINTFGFRGEALPSIAAVSRFRLITRAKGKPAGIEIEIEGGKIIAEKQAGTREGTVIEIKDLFFNTPARRKFLKTERTEMSNIAEAITMMAMAHPSVRFILSNDDETVLDVAKTKNLRERVRELYDGEYESRLIDISGDLPGVRISGLVGKPELAQSHRRDQIFFVNNRPIKSPALGFALAQAFRGLVMDGRHPVGIVFLDVNPDLVDVNVHPTKREVRLSSERAIQSFMIETIRRHVLGKDLFPEMPVKPGTVDRDSWSAKEQQQERFCAEDGRKIAQNLFGAEIANNLGVDVADGPRFTDHGSQFDIGSVRLLGQMHASFLVGEYAEGLVIIDQHAAHERVQFEAVLNSFEKEHVESQGLLMPVVMKLTAQEEILLKDSLELLKQVGFVIESFGPKTYAIQSVPLFVDQADVESFLKSYLERREHLPDLSVSGERQEEIAALIACKSRSVKAKDRMTHEAMNALVQLLQKTKSPFSCPHGRPTILKITLSDFEKHFKRK